MIRNYAAQIHGPKDHTALSFANRRDNTARAPFANKSLAHAHICLLPRPYETLTGKPDK